MSTAVLTPPVQPATPAPAGDPRWVRPSVAGLLAATGLLYLWDLSANGWANTYYAAAVQAGTESWEAFFYGSSDAGSSITVDKPPASLWVMEISARVFGLSSWSMLVPQALMGVATVGLVYLTVRRVVGPAAGLFAGAAMALTPVAVLMFRYDNPDALLVLLMTAAAYATARAVERASLRWMVGVGVLIGVAFLTKSLQSVLVVPGFALAYLLAAPTTLGRRIGHVLAAAVALVITAGWWIAVVDLVPVSSRPYIGGSTDNTFWDLLWGYNGLGRIFGEGSGSVAGVAGVAGGGGFGGDPGIGRLFDTAVGGQISWLLPAALVLLLAGLVVVGRAPRTDPTRAALVSWGSWLVVTGLTFSLMEGTFHEYYTVALAPAIAVLAGIGGGLLWRRRGRPWARLAMGATLLGTAVWAHVLLSRTPDFVPWVRWVVLAVGVLAAAGLVVVHLGRRSLAAGVLAAALVAVAGGPAGYAADTVTTAKTGSIITAGPASADGSVFGGRPADGGPPAGLELPNGMTVEQLEEMAPGGGPGGGFVGGEDVSEEVTALLAEDADDYTWAAATISSQGAAGYQLASGAAVMPIGGFTGSDPSPTLAQFQSYVTDGEVHWFIGGATGGPGGGPDGSGSAIATWVAATFTAQTVDGVTLYDLSAPVG